MLNLLRGTNHNVRKVIEGFLWMQEHHKHVSFINFFATFGSFDPLTPEGAVQMTWNFQDICFSLVFITCIKEKLVEDFGGCSIPPENPYFPKNESFPIFWHVLPPNWWKYGQNTLKLTEILHLIKFHTMFDNESYWGTYRAWNSSNKWFLTKK